MKNFFKELFWLIIGLILISMIFSTPRFDADAAPAETGVRVFDGDTFNFNGERVRIANIDTPELFSPKCPAEKRLARIAKLRLQQLLGDGANITLERQPKPDRYGRTVAAVLVNGKDIGQTLITEGLAAEWKGHRFNWCCG